ncbi:sialate O-acetylesterase [Xanthomonas sp. XNM01]|uniref:sialate O-acetylesterase n=1 Tax=Xanthomonas sp. XNM01 TaxID=2769289 RepID=UPI00177CC8BF|nr:sialate O-acetylesterase [Xanthomonas sp. XNM01]MBD9367681.1 beta galactosidase jelly roll domain-containing protein [Xanthomonas sp. XNM01]
MRALLLPLLLACAAGAEAVELPRVFGEGMVLQRDQPLPVWGRADAGVQVRVEIAGQAATARADAEGAWRVVLAPLPAGGPHVLRVDDGRAPVALGDVLVGDVWLASGQSNMEWPIGQSADADAQIASATDPRIRHFKIPKSWSGAPQWQLAGGVWEKASPQVAGHFSAVAHQFARELRRSTGVPIGIVDSTWGGSSIEAWTDAATQGLDPAAQAARAEALQRSDAQALAQTRGNLARWPELPADDSGWQAATLDESDWVPIQVPALWETVGWNGMDGVAWYRTTFTLSAAEAKAGVLLGVGRIDDSDVTWVNGVEVGQTRMAYDTPRRYPVPATALRAGLNHVAVRVTDTGGGGGIDGKAGELFVQPLGAAPRPLDGTWRFRVAQAATVALVDDKNQHPALLYNAMIHPLQAYGIRGVIWYQGEANAGTVAQATAYRSQFPALIRQWRAQWHAPALPFLWVQLASFSSGSDAGDTSPWSLLREAQTATLALPATAQAVTLDIGEAHDIHPRNKREVGRRLALGARAVAYGDPVDWRGPVVQEVSFADHAAQVRFDSDDGLAVRGGGREVHGFAVAGADRVFHPAQATLVGDTVVARSTAVPAPVAVRYAWRDEAGAADLVDEAGLPAGPFRSDTW